jgi:hypothetical protein
VVQEQEGLASEESAHRTAIGAEFIDDPFISFVYITHDILSFPRKRMRTGLSFLQNTVS